jgi:hypothetical protein
MFLAVLVTFFQFSFYALSVCLVFFVSKAAWYEYTISTYGICNNSMVLDRPFVSSATLHLPFAALSTQIIHSGTDALVDG